MQGTVGEGAAIEFIAFTEIHDKLPSIEDMVNNPEGIEIPEEPSMLYAMSLLIGATAKPDNCDQLIKLVNRLPPEFQVSRSRIFTVVKMKPKTINQSKNGRRITLPSSLIINLVQTNQDK